MYKRRNEHGFHHRDRDHDRAEPTEHEMRGLHSELARPLPRRYDERHYPRDYERDRRGRR